MDDAAAEASDVPMEQRAGGLSQKVAEALVTERQALNAAIDAQTRDEEAHARENEFAAFFTGETKDVVDLDVTGERISVKRATLQMCADSPLARKFDDETWTQAAQSVADDSDDEYVQIDFSAYCFGKIIDHLRICALAGGLEANMPGPVVRDDQKENFTQLVKYYFPGNEEIFLQAAVKLWPMKACSAHVTQQEGNITHIDCGTTNGHCCAVGIDPLPASAVWKVKVVRAASTWGIAGIIGNRAPIAGQSYTDATSYGWAGGGQVYIGGQYAAAGGWTGWAANDEAILKLDTVAVCLKMWHKRTAKLYQINLPARDEGWVLHVGLHTTNVTCMQLMAANSAEMALVQ